MWVKLTVEGRVFVEKEFDRKEAPDIIIYCSMIFEMRRYFPEQKYYEYRQVKDVMTLPE